MQYPLISEYLAAIREAKDNLDKLSHMMPVLDNYGEPYRSSGAFAVVFKMKDEQTGSEVLHRRAGRSCGSLPPDSRRIGVYRLTLYYFSEVSGEGAFR